MKNLSMTSNMRQPKHKIIISGGGTGGHIFPAIAIANALKKKLKDPDILFIGARGKMEMEKVSKAGYPIEGLWISGLQRKLSSRNLVFPFKVISSLVKAGKITRKFKPDVVVGVGGFASGPTLRVASKRKIPTLIQEQNSFPGITNKLLGRWVNRICVAYEGMDKFFPASKIVMTGNPVRQDIINLDGKQADAYQFFDLSSQKKTLLIIGGSQGARTINIAVQKSLESLIRKQVQVIWQTGIPYYETALIFKQQLELSLGAEAVGQHLRIIPFIDRMDYVYAAADLVISRAGAIAISELCAVGLPVILVPLPSAAEDHQTKNALALVEKKAAVLVKDQDLDSKLDAALQELLGDDQKREMMKSEIVKLARTDAVDKISDEIIGLIQTK
ncbi:MAG: undecaprenyldiphospho-muramoylpentapeptide beta-N-acetylglucosaminyltransferase [Bacteroidota bacterium]|nr:undecaprenyldiphospho-muramoylpentapeptide beta-N-acetylglucosaminyltransferase [Bacteroidota bacterium]